MNVAPLSRALMALLVMMPLSQGLARKPLLIEENEFLKKPFSFTSTEGQAVENGLLTPPAKPFPFPESQIKAVNGVRTIFVNGEAMPTWSRSTRAPEQGMPVERQLREAGMRLYIVDVNLTSEGKHLGERSLATAPEPAFAEFQEKVGRILAEVPDAIIMIRLWLLNVDRDYVERYPLEVLQGANGESDWGWGYYYGFHNVRPNMLEKWKHYCGEHLKRFIHKVGGSSFAPRVAGFYLAAMNSGEWWYYKGEGDVGWDYSPARKVAFEQLALAKYGDRKSTAAAWGVPDDEKLFELPTLEERRRWPFPPLSKNADYLQTLNLPVTEAALLFGKIIKTATGGKSLSGMEITAAFLTSPNNGTVYTRHLLESPDIDFFGGPPTYKNRKAGETPLYRIASASLEAYGKLWLNEGDYRSPLSFGTASAAAGEPPIDAASMREILRREFARGAIFNYPTYLMDFGQNWFYEPSILNGIKEINRADAAIRAVGLKRHAEIAVVTDQESQLYSNFYSNPAEYMLKGVLDRIGTGWNFYELTDFLKSEALSKYRFVIFLNIRALSNPEREAINRLKRDGRTILWMHDPGVTDLSEQGHTAEKLASDLIGMKLRTGPKPTEIVIQEKGFKRANLLPPGKTKEAVEGEEAVLFQQVSPSDAAVGRSIGNLPSPLYCADERAISLAESPEGHAHLAIRDLPGWTSVYTSFCRLDPSILRQLARRAGCFIYNDSDDVFFGGGNFIALHASEDGEKKLTFPSPTGVYDVFEHKTISKSTAELLIPMKRGETRFLYLGGTEAFNEKAEAASMALEQSGKAFAARYPAGTMDMRFREWWPKSPGDHDNEFEITTFTPPAVVVSGPFASSDEAIATLDESLASLQSISDWEPLPDDPNKLQFGLRSDDFLYVTKPLPTLAPSDLSKWYGIRLEKSAWDQSMPEIYISDYRLGMAVGQSYGVAFTLEADETTSLRLHFAPQGESRLWIDGQEIAADKDGIYEPVFEVGKQPKLVVFRLKGRESSTGFSLKIAAPQRGREAYLQQRPSTYAMMIPADADCLNPPPSGLRLRLSK